MNYIEFKKLLKQWNRETAMMSTVHGKASNPISKIIFDFALLNFDNKKLITSYAFLNLRNIHLALIILHKLLENGPEIPENLRGHMKAIEEIYRVYGYDNHFIKTNFNAKAYWNESCFDSSAKELEHKCWNDEDLLNFKKLDMNLNDFKKLKYEEIFL